MWENQAAVIQERKAHCSRVSWHKLSISRDWRASRNCITGWWSPGCISVSGGRVWGSWWGCGGQICVGLALLPFCKSFNISLLQLFHIYVTKQNFKVYQPPRMPCLGCDVTIESFECDRECENVCKISVIQSSVGLTERKQGKTWTSLHANTSPPF